MKKIMLIIFSVTMLFTACEKQTENITDTTAKISAYTPKTQIDLAEEFDGITFGMTKDEIISFLGKTPDSIYELDDNKIDFKDIVYRGEEHFNVSNVDVSYRLNKDDNMLRSVIYDFSYDESEQEQFMNDYETVKEEVLRRYPEEIWIDSRYNEIGNDTTLKIYTENRCVVFHSANDFLKMSIFIDEYTPGIDDTKSNTDTEENDPAENFGGITFGMTEDEVIEINGRDPDHFTYEIHVISYENETFFNISNAGVAYGFDENWKLNGIYVLYSYYEDTGDDSFQSDYDSIKEELLKRYSESANNIDKTDDELTISTYNRHITLLKSDDPAIIVSISSI